MGRARSVELALETSESLWSLVKGGRRIECELHPVGDDGFALHVLRAGELCVRTPFDRRDLAMQHADALERDLGANGWKADENHGA